MADLLRGELVELRPPGADDVDELARIRATPEVAQRWSGGPDFASSVRADVADHPDSGMVIVHDGHVAGWIEWTEEDDPDYRHAGIDVYVDPARHGRGVGTDAVRTVARHLVRDRGHHRLTIDPAVDNVAAIRAYTKVGFRPVGVMREYERGPDFTWHDNLLMDLLAEDLAPDG